MHTCVCIFSGTNTKHINICMQQTMAINYGESANLLLYYTIMLSVLKIWQVPESIYFILLLL